MLIGAEHLGSVGVGVTGPQFFRADDEKTYVVKLQHNPLGPKVLVNEFIGAKFGEIMKLCFPPSRIILINEHTLPSPMTVGITLGRHFASQYLKNTEYVEKNLLAKVTNITEMAGVILFDNIFHNADRANNGRNLLLRQEDTGYKIYAIDNSHLIRSGKWTLESLTLICTKIKLYHRHTFGLLLKDYLSPQDFLPYLDRVSLVSNDDIEAILDELPVEWLPDKSEKQALAHYIKIGCDKAEERWKTLCNYIPKRRGGQSRLL